MSKQFGIILLFCTYVFFVYMHINPIIFFFQIKMKVKYTGHLYFAELANLNTSMIIHRLIQRACIPVTPVSTNRHQMSKKTENTIMMILQVNEMYFFLFSNP